MPQDELSVLARKVRQLEHLDRSTRDSGFDDSNVFHDSSDAKGGEEDEENGSSLGCSAAELLLDQYGLDGPLPPLRAPAAASSASEGCGVAAAAVAAGAPLMAAVVRPTTNEAVSAMVSSNARRKRKDELKQATIKQHYYPEGGWGWVVVLAGFLAQAMTHGLQMSYGVMMAAYLMR